jgi:hypothetical protein
MVDMKAIRERAQAARAAVAVNRDHVSDSARDVPALLDLVDKLTGALLLAETEIDQIAGYSGSSGNWPLHECAASIEKALTAAGLPDHASRDAERARRAGR